MATTHEYDSVTHPEHYLVGGIETLSFIEAKGLNFHLGQVVKYVARCGYKVGADPIEDLRKAQFYLSREIERRSQWRTVT